jgi:hypothetical protein
MKGDGYVMMEEGNLISQVVVGQEGRREGGKYHRREGEREGALLPCHPYRTPGRPRAFSPQAS